MKVDVIDIKGKVVRSIEVKDHIFDIEPNESSVYEGVKNELANRRQGTHSTKTKAEVSGSGTKPWKQKGTGRARVGTKRNPVWYHGGVAFGPKPRDYSYVIPKKVKQLAYKSVFSRKIDDKNFVVIEDFDLASGKTKDLNQILTNILGGDKTSFILSDGNDMIRRAGNNISWITLLNASRLNLCDLHYAKKIMVTEKTLEQLNNSLDK